MQQSKMKSYKIGYKKETGHNIHYIYITHAKINLKKMLNNAISNVTFESTCVAMVNGKAAKKQGCHYKRIKD